MRSRIDFFVIVLIITLAISISFVSLQNTLLVFAQPTITDSNLKAELVVGGLSSPTSMAFLDDNNALILEKEGSVRLVSNGQLQQEPVLQLPGVESNNERGLLGIAIMNNSNSNSNTSSGSTGIDEYNNVFLYVTENQAQTTGVQTEGEVRNRVYSYRWDGTSLTDPQLLLDLPSGPGTNHQGGKIKIGPDNQLYVIVGEMQREGQLQNIKGGPGPDDTGVIIRINPNNGSPSQGNPLSSDPNNPLSKYYAYGIRNSFGLDFDPVTGKLWDTENGEDVYDEINFVEPGFNSGWKAVMGPIATSGISAQSDLVNFEGSHYADPVFSWAESRGITDIGFLKSSKLGDAYKDNIFVGDITAGNLFFFKINDDRTGLSLKDSSSLSDLIANNDDESSEATLGTGFLGITDIETGPDGYLYILTYDQEANGQGSLYRIIPSTV
jgi:glucose/arabinose dehydrogenase